MADGPSILDLAAAALNVGIIVVLAGSLRRLGHRPTGPIVALLGYFIVRSFTRIVENGELLQEPHPRVEFALDALTVAILLYLLTQSARLARVLLADHDEAHYRAEEYERALQHYTQVVRHRLFNPLSVIKGGAVTLRDGTVADPHVRRELLDAMIASAEEIERVSLLPERRDELERELDAIPSVTDQPPQPTNSD